MSSPQMTAEPKIDQVELYVHITFALLEPAVVSNSSTDHWFGYVNNLLSQCDPQTSSNSTWKLVRNTNTQVLTKNLFTQTLWGWGTTVCVWTSPPGDSAACWSLSTLGYRNCCTSFAFVFFNLIYALCLYLYLYICVYLAKQRVCSQFSVPLSIHWSIWQNWLSSWHLQSPDVENEK